MSGLLALTEQKLKTAILSWSSASPPPRLGLGMSDRLISMSQALWPSWGHSSRVLVSPGSGCGREAV